MLNEIYKHHYINDDVIIDFEIPEKLQSVIKEAEKLDSDENIEFICVAELIDNMCKGYYSSGKLTKKQWELLTYKYSVNAPM